MFSFFAKMFNGILEKLGFYHKEANVVFLGLDNAGKTTLLQMLKEDKYTQQPPTQQPHMEELTIGKVRFLTYDLGGHEIARKLWKDYSTVANAIIYIVDASAPSRFADTKKELDLVLTMTEASNVPIAVLGNKIDKKGAVSEEILREELALQTEYTWGKEKNKKNPAVSDRPIEVFMCSIAKRMGYVEAFKWVNNFI